ncbi:MAG: hypothetical protein M5U26_21250 [Planctomycetota bacterium]|nr:hypothetical protein [Planctomycetota bacterium]
MRREIAVLAVCLPCCFAGAEQPGASVDASALLRQLAHEDHEVRDRAALKLLENAATVWPRLREAAESEDLTVRALAQRICRVAILRQLPAWEAELAAEVKRIESIHEEAVAKLKSDLLGVDVAELQRQLEDVSHKVEKLEARIEEVRGEPPSDERHTQLRALEARLEKLRDLRLAALEPYLAAKRRERDRAPDLCKAIAELRETLNRDGLPDRRALLRELAAVRKGGLQGGNLLVKAPAAWPAHFRPDLIVYPKPELTRPLSFQFVDTPYGEVLNFLRSMPIYQCEFNVSPEVRTLLERKTVTLTVSNEPLAAALRKIHAAIGAEVGVGEDNRLTVTLSKAVALDEANAGK